MTNNEQLFEINGQVESLIYRNEENGYTVLEISGEEALITATGVMPLVNVGESVKLFGAFKNHPTYGEQFAVSAFERTMPENLDGILKYLSSGAIKGIGPSTARRLVAEFGADTLSVLENEPERVAQLKGISLNKARDISEQLKSVVGIRELMIYLAAYDVSANAAVRIWKKYGNGAVAAIEENPYVLCEEGFGISFETADMIALAHDIPQDARIRIRAALSFVLKHNQLNGHTCLPAEKLTEATASLLEIELISCESALKEMIGDSSLILDTIDEKDYIFLPSLYDAETYIAARMKMLLRFPAQAINGAEEKISAIEAETGMEYASLQKKSDLRRAHDRSADPYRRPRNRQDDDPQRDHPTAQRKRSKGIFMRSDRQGRTADDSRDRR